MSKGSPITSEEKGISVPCSHSQKVSQDQGMEYIGVKKPTDPITFDLKIPVRDIQVAMEDGLLGARSTGFSSSI